jgi:hypothetical protein
MRGDLRINSGRAPYRRAGLVWVSVGPVLAAITSLDGERLLKLVRDPGLTIEIEDTDAKWKRLPAIGADVTADQAQMMIDTIAAEMPPADDPTLPTFTVADALAERDAISAKLGEAEAAIRALQAQLDEAEAARAKSAEAVDMLQADKILLQRKLDAAIKAGGAKAANAVKALEADQTDTDQPPADPASPPSEG